MLTTSNHESAHSSFLLFRPVFTNFQIWTRENDIGEWLVAMELRSLGEEEDMEEIALSSSRADLKLEYSNRSSQHTFVSVGRWERQLLRSHHFQIDAKLANSIGSNWSAFDRHDSYRFEPDWYEALSPLPDRYECIESNSIDKKYLHSSAIDTNTSFILRRSIRMYRFEHSRVAMHDLHDSIRNEMQRSIPT